MLKAEVPRVSHLQRLIGRVEKHVSTHPDVEAIANRDLDRWLNIEIASCDFDPRSPSCCPRAAEAVSCAVGVVSPDVPPASLAAKI